MSNIELTDEQQQQIEDQQIINPATKGFIDNPSEFVQKLLETSHIPKHLIIKYWAFSSPNVKLSFLTDEEVNIMMYRFYRLRLTIIQSVPKEAYDSDMQLDLQQMEFELSLALNRSKGANGFNDRILISAQTNATLGEKNVDNITPTQSSGWGSTIMRKLRGG